jgi:hypothetical protein
MSSAHADYHVDPRVEQRWRAAKDGPIAGEGEGAGLRVRKLCEESKLNESQTEAVEAALTMGDGVLLVQVRRLFICFIIVSYMYVRS